MICRSQPVRVTGRRTPDPWSVEVRPRADAGRLTAAEIHSLTVADGEGRVVLKVDGRQDRAERNRIELMPEVGR